MSRTLGVYSLSGPSSTVSAATRSDRRPRNTLPGWTAYGLDAYTAQRTAGAASQSAGVRASAPRRRAGRRLAANWAPGDEQGDLALLHELVALIQDAPLLDHD